MTRKTPRPIDKKTISTLARQMKAMEKAERELKRGSAMAKKMRKECAKAEKAAKDVVDTW